MWKTGESGPRKGPRVPGSTRLRLAVSIVGDAAFERAVAVAIEIGEVVPPAFDVLPRDDAQPHLVIDIDAARDAMHQVRHRVGAAITVRIERRRDEMTSFS